LDFCCTIQFLSRDAMHKHGLRCHAVSVHLSVMFVYFAKMSKRIPKQFSSTGRSIILVFLHQILWQYSNGDPPNGGIECRWGGQKSRLSANIWLLDWWLLDVRATTATVDRAVYRTHCYASVNLVYHILQHGRPKRREENKTECSAHRKRKSNVAINIVLSSQEVISKQTKQLLYNSQGWQIKNIIKQWIIKTSNN